MNFEFRVNGQRLDYMRRADFAYEIWRKVINLANIDERAGDQTKTIKFPLTKNNSLILNTPESLQTDRSVQQNYPCDMVVDGNVIFSGTLTVKEVDLKEGTILAYAVGNQIDWATQIGDKTLRQIGSLRTIDFFGLWTSLQINDDLAVPDHDQRWDVAFPLVSYGNFFMPEKYTAGNLISTTYYDPPAGYIDLEEPIEGITKYITNRASNAHFALGDYPGAVYLANAIKAIFKDVGLNATGSLFDDAEFRRLIILHTSQGGPEWNWGTLGKPLPSLLEARMTTPWNALFAEGLPFPQQRLAENMAVSVVQQETLNSVTLGYTFGRQYLALQELAWTDMSQNYGFTIPSDTFYVAPAKGRYTITFRYQLFSSRTDWQLNYTGGDPGTILTSVAYCENPRLMVAVVVGDPGDWTDGVFGWLLAGKYGGVAQTGPAAIVKAGNLSDEDYGNRITAQATLDQRMEQLRLNGVVPYYVDARDGIAPTYPPNTNELSGPTTGSSSGIFEPTRGSTTWSRMYDHGGEIVEVPLVLDLEAGQVVRLVFGALSLDTEQKEDSYWWNAPFITPTQFIITNQAEIGQCSMVVNRIQRPDGTDYPDRLNAAALLSDTITQRQLLQDVIRMFNIYLYVDANGNAVFERWPQFFLPSNQAYDLTGRARLKSGTKRLQEVPAEYQFLYADDDDVYWDKTGLNADYTQSNAGFGGTGATQVQLSAAAPTGYAFYPVVQNIRIGSEDERFNAPIYQELTTLLLPTIASQEALDRVQNSPESNSLAYGLHIVSLRGLVDLPAFNAAVSGVRPQGLPHLVWNPATDDEYNTGPFQYYIWPRQLVTVFNQIERPADGSMPQVWDLSFNGRYGLFQMNYATYLSFVRGTYEIEVDAYLSAKDYLAIKDSRRLIKLDDVVFRLADIRGYNPLNQGKVQLRLLKI